ncbi:MAG: DUF2306 domain-containing protein [Pseudomonadota bacterium]|nr:DUF2306 domain-containing protein [Pseudomonadota bacterium]
MLESAITYFTSWTSGVVGQSHLLAALIALASGAGVLWARKGTPVHVAWGYTYIASMVVLNGTALVKYDLTGGFNAFHAGALGSSVTLAGAFAAAMIYRRTRDRRAIAAHGQLMIWSYFGLVMALVAEVFTRAVPFMLHGDGGWSRFSTALALLMIATAIPTYWYARRERNRILGPARGRA